MPAPSQRGHHGEQFQLIHRVRAQERGPPRDFTQNVSRTSPLACFWPNSVLTKPSWPMRNFAIDIDGQERRVRICFGRHPTEPWTPA